MRIAKWTCLILALGAWGWGQPVMAAGQSAKTLDKQIVKPVTCEYLLSLPKGYGEKDQRWALMLFLHGAGERGSDLNKVKVHGPPKLIEQGKDLPFIVVSPQCPSEPLVDRRSSIRSRRYWMRSRPTIDVDKDRIYLTGLSMGGFGTWSLACHQPERFAAIAPICGGGQWFLANRLKDVPVWAFHGGQGFGVVPHRTCPRRWWTSVKRAGGDAKLTVYPDAGHDSWTEPATTTRNSTIGSSAIRRIARARPRRRASVRRS